MDSWHDSARVELMLVEDTSIETVNEHQEFNVPFAEMIAKRPGRSGESRWFVFPSERHARRYATALLERRLRDDPTSFDLEWRGLFMTIDPRVRERRIEEDSERYAREVRAMDPHGLYEEVGLGDLDDLLNEVEIAEEELEQATDRREVERLSRELRRAEERYDSMIDRATEIFRQRAAEDIRAEMEDVPNYLIEQGIDPDNPPTWVRFDTDAAVRNALETHDIGYYLDTYDGMETLLSSGALAFGRRGSRRRRRASKEREMERLRRLVQQGDEDARRRLERLERRQGQRGGDYTLRLGYDVLVVFQSWWYGMGDPLYAVLSRRGNSVDIVYLDISRNEMERLEEVAEEILEDTETNRNEKRVARHLLDQIRRVRS